MVFSSPPLAPGDLIRCPHCHRWHPLIHRDDVNSTPHANDMLYWQCSTKGTGGYFYAGQLGGTCRFQTKRPLA